MKILPDYEHMEYRDVYTCRTYLLLASAFVGEQDREAAWIGPLTHSTRQLRPRDRADLLGVCWFALGCSVLRGLAQPGSLLSGNSRAAAQTGWVSAAALGFWAVPSKITMFKMYRFLRQSGSLKTFLLLNGT